MKRSKCVLLLLMIVAACSGQGRLLGDAADSIIYLQKSTFRVVYDYTRLCPALVWWVTTGYDIIGSKRMPGSNFVTDYDLPAPRARSSWFRRSGFHRGHLCPSADRLQSSDDNRSTFIMSNVAPMWPQFNTKPWLKAENFCRTHARLCGQSNCIAGCLWCTVDSVRPSVGRIQVPDSFYRAMLCPVDSTHNVYWLFPGNAWINEERRFRVSKRKFTSSMRRYLKYYIPNF